MTNIQVKSRYYQYKSFLRGLSDISFRFDKLLRDPEFTTIPLEQAVSELYRLVTDAKVLLQNAPNGYEIHKTT